MNHTALHSRSLQLGREMEGWGVTLSVAGGGPPLAVKGRIYCSHQLLGTVFAKGGSTQDTWTSGQLLAAALFKHYARMLTGATPEKDSPGRTRM